MSDARQYFIENFAVRQAAMRTARSTHPPASPAKPKKRAANVNKPGAEQRSASRKQNRSQSRWKRKLGAVLRGGNQKKWLGGGAKKSEAQEYWAGQLLQEFNDSPVDVVKRYRMREIDGYVKRLNLAIQRHDTYELMDQLVRLHTDVGRTLEAAQKAYANINGERFRI